MKSLYHATRSWVFVCALVSFLIGSSLHAQVVFNVTTNAGDNSAGSIGEAIQLANAAPGSDTIKFVGLSNPDIITISVPSYDVITEDLVILGGDSITIDAGSMTRMLDVDATVANCVLVLEGLNFINGRVGPGALGGAVRFIPNTSGSLYITDCEFSGNRSSFGGAVYAEQDLIINRSIFDNNNASESGGLDDGGAIYFDGNTLLINNSQFTNNLSLRDGGAIYINAATSADITNSSINRNNCPQFGAGILSNADLNVQNSTVSGNGNLGHFRGAGLYLNGAGISSIDHSTIYSNRAFEGGGVFAANAAATINLENSIISDNIATSSNPDFDNTAASTIVSNGYNWIGDNTGLGLLGGTGDINNAGTANLGPFQDNGGATFTHLPNAASGVIGNGTVTPLATDQRGVSRATPTTIGAVSTCPIAEFTADTVCANATTRFINLSKHPVAPGYVYRWDFESDNTDLTTGNYFFGDTLTFQYPSPGVYTATLVIIPPAGCTPDTFVQDVLVQSSPDVSFFADSVACVNETVTFTDSTVITVTPNDLHYFWTFPPSGPTKYAPGNRTNLFSTAGNYTVELLVYDSLNMCFDNFTRGITIQDAPEAHVQLDGQTRDTFTVCQFDSIFFNDSSIAAASPNVHILDFSSGASDTTYSPSFITLTFDTVGLIEVIYTVGPKPACQGSDTFYIDVVPAPVISAFETDTTCFPDSTDFAITLTANAGIDVDSFYFFNGDGSITFSLDTGERAFLWPTLIAGFDTVFVQAIDENGCVSNTLVDSVIQFDTITSAALYTDTACAMDSFYVEAVLTGGTGVTDFSWDWDDDLLFDASSGTTDNDSAYFSTGGTINYNVQVTFGNGACLDTFTGTARIIGLPSFSLEIDTVCTGTRTEVLVVYDSLDVLSSGDTTRFFDFDNTYPPFDVTKNIVDTASNLFGTGGSYPIAVQIVDDSGCASMVVVDTALVIDQPTFTFTRDTTCLGDSVELIVIDAIPTDVIYYFDFSGNDSIAEFVDTVSSTAGVSGKYIYPTFGDSAVNVWTVALPSGCASDTIQDSVKTIRPLVAVTAVPQDSACSFDSMSVQYVLTEFDSTMGFAANQWAIMFDTDFDTVVNKVQDVVAFTDTLLDSVAYFVTSDQWVTYQYFPRYDDGIFNCPMMTTFGVRDTLVDSVYVFGAPDISLVSLDTACPGDDFLIQVTDSGNSTLSALKYFYNFDTAGISGSVNATSYADTFITTLILDPGSYNVSAWAIDTVFGCRTDTAYANELGDSFVVRQLPEASFYYTNICSNEPVQFTDSSSFFATAFAGIDSSYWNIDTTGGAVDIADIDNGVAPFGASVLLAGGLYDFTYTIVDSFGCQDDTSSSIFVSTAPIANFVLDTVCYGDTSVFIDSSITSDSSLYSWNFDGGAFEITNKLIAAPDSGDQSFFYSSIPPTTGLARDIYTVTLIVQDSLGCSDTVSNNDAVVLANPVINDFRTDTVCLGDSVIFFSDVIAATSIALRYDYWADSNLTVNIPTAVNPNSTSAPVGYYSSAGTYLAQLVAVNTTTACRTDSFFNFYLRSNPIVNLVIDTVCFGSENTFISNVITDSTVNSATFDWKVRRSGISAFAYDSSNVVTGLNPDPALSANDTITPIIDVAGAYLASASSDRLILKVTDEHGCFDSLISDQPYVVENPNFTINTDTVCSGNPTTMDAILVDFDSITDFSNIVYTWYIDTNTVVSSMEDTTFVYPADNNRRDSVSLTITAPTLVAGLSCETVRTDPTVYVPLTPTVTINTDTVCFGDATTFEVLSIVVEDIATDTTFSWSTVNEGVLPASDADLYNYVLAAFGTDSATLIITDDLGCSDTVGDATLYVNENPTASINTDTVCEGQTTAFTVNYTTAAGTTDTTFNWTANNFGVVSNGDTANVDAALPAGQDTVTLTITDGEGCTVSISDSTLYVRANPMAVINTDTVCSGQGTSFDVISYSVDPASADTTWEWSSVNEGIITTDRSIVFTLATPGADSATLIVTDDLGCSDTIADGTLYTNISPIINVINTDTVCLGIATRFTAVDFTTDVGASDTTFVWSTGNDGLVVTSDESDTAAILSTPGTDVAELIIIDNGGCSDTLTDNTLYVQPAPTATINTDTVCETNATQFTVISFTTDMNATDTSFTWSTGLEGTISVNDTGDVAFISSNTGADVATLTINDGTCNGIITDNTLYVRANPDVTINTDTACFGEPTNFDVTSLTLDPIATDTIINWALITGGLISNGDTLNVDATLASTGQDTAIILITDDFGCLDTATDNTLYVFEQPNVAIAVDTGCFGQRPNNFTILGITTDPASADTTFDWYTSNEGLISSSNMGDISFLLSSAGADSATLILTDGNGCTDTAGDNSVYAAELPDILSLTGDSVCFRDSNSFAYEIVHDDVINSDSLFWQFDFPSLSNDTLVFAVAVPANDTLNDVTRYSYGAPGTYDVQMGVLDNLGCFALSNVITVRVDSAPTADFTADTACLGSPTFFTLNATNSPLLTNLHLWDYRNLGVTDNTAPTNTTYTYANAGVYDAKLTVINLVNGCADSMMVPVLVDQAPDASFNFNVNCPGDSTEFFALADVGVSYNWDFEYPGGPMQSNLSTQSGHLYTSTGLRDVQLIVLDTLTGCSDTVIEPVDIAANVTASFQIAPDDTICEGEAITFTPSFIPMTASVQWDFEGDGSIDNTQNDTVDNIYSTNGVYDATFIVDDGAGCVDTGRRTITVFTTPDVDIIGDTVCLGDSSTVTDLSPTGPNLSFAWDLDGNGTTDNVNPGDKQFLFGAVSDNTITLTITDLNNSCSNTDSVVLSVIEPVQTSFTVPASLCENDAEITLTGLPAGGTFRVEGVVTNTIDPSDFAAGTNLSITYNNTSVANCPSIQSSATLTIAGLPALVANPADTTVTINYPALLNVSGADSFAWSPQVDIISSSDNNDEIVVLHDRPTTTYTVTGTDSNGCVNSVDVVVNTNADARVAPDNAFSPNGDGINDFWFIENILAYPNAEVTVFSRWGEKIYNIRGYVRPFDGIYLNQDLPVGTYYYVIDLGDGGPLVSGYVDLKR